MPQEQQPNLYRKMVNHPRFIYFLLYSLSCFILGQTITCLGPLFPYLAEHQNRLQTQYSTLFLFRACGHISGAVLLNFISKKFTLHQFMGVGIVMMGVFSVLFNSSESLFFKGLCAYGTAVGASFQHISVNVAALDCFRGENVLMWIQSIHGCFGIGGFIGPYVVYLFQLNTLTVLGIAAIISAVFYYYLQTPQKIVDVKKMQEQDKKILLLPKISLYLISIGFLMAVGEEVAYGGWISSYAVLYNFSTKEHAIVYSSVYWISVTFFRFALAGVSGSPSKKIRNLSIVGIVTTFLSFFLIFHVNSQFGMIIMSILYGLTISGLYSLLFTVPGQFGYTLTIEQSTILVIWASIGQGCSGVGVGKMMQWFSYDWLLYGMCLINIALIIIIEANSRVLNKQHLQNQNSDKLQKLINSYQTPQSKKPIQLKQFS